MRALGVLTRHRERQVSIDCAISQSLAASLTRALAHSLACPRGETNREPDIETHIGETLDHGVVLLLPMRVRLMIHIHAYTYDTIFTLGYLGDAQSRGVA